MAVGFLVFENSLGSLSSFWRLKFAVGKRKGIGISVNLMRK